MSDSLDTDHARHFVGPSLGPNCLQRLGCGENSFQQNPLNISNIVAVNADFKETTLEAKSRKTLKSADPLKTLRPSPSPLAVIESLI